MQSSLCRKAQAFTLSLLVCSGWTLRARADVNASDACDKFAASQRQEPSEGTLLRLARCHADAGKAATGRAEYLAAARLARAHGKTKQAEEAEQRAAELGPRIMYLSIRIDAQRATDLVVSRDGEELTPNLDEPVPVDPGSHVISAQAPGYAAWSTTVTSSQPGQVQTITIPELTPLLAPHAPQRARAPSAAPSEQRARPTAAWVAAGVGAGALLSAAVLGWIARSDWDDVNTRGLCQAGRCNHEGLAERQQAQNLADLATTGVAIGVAAFASAVLLYNERPKRRASVSIGVNWGKTMGSLALRGEF
jgi:hypothetical protein